MKKKKYHKIFTKENKCAKFQPKEQFPRNAKFVSSQFSPQFSKLYVILDSWSPDVINLNQQILFSNFSLSEEILDKLLLNVAGEIEGTCNSMVDEVYEKEFVHSSSH